MSEHRFNPLIDASPEEIKKQKEIINNEGTEGSATVQIGTEDEQKKLDIERENEGKYLDLASCIVAKKQTIISVDEIPENEKGRLEKGVCYLQHGNLLGDDFEGNSLIFIDRDNNISFVYFKENSVKSLDGIPDPYSRAAEIAKQLVELGFVMKKEDHFVLPLVKQVESYKKNKEEKEKAEIKENFAF